MLSKGSEPERSSLSCQVRTKRQNSQFSPEKKCPKQSEKSQIKINGLVEFRQNGIILRSRRRKVEKMLVRILIVPSWSDYKPGFVTGPTSLLTSFSRGLCAFVSGARPPAASFIRGATCRGNNMLMNHYPQSVPRFTMRLPCNQPLPTNLSSTLQRCLCVRKSDGNLQLEVLDVRLFIDTLFALESMCNATRLKNA